MNKYAGTQTEKNLEAAFAGESQARNKYTYFASVAKKEGYEFFMETTTNQIFITLPDTRKAELEKQCVLSFWEKPEPEHTVVRFATSWATTREDVLALAAIL